MPGIVKVSVFEADRLPSTVEDGHLVSVRVSVGKREYQTKPSQAFGGRTASWKYEFSHPVTNLRDNLVIAAIDSKEEIITKSEIQTTAIIQKGFWDTFFSFKGGGRVHLKLCFVLSDEERKKIELMRLEALRRKGLQNLLYRSTYQVPKPVPIRTKSFVSGVTITELSADSCLNEKDNENKENHASNTSLRCPKLLEAPKEKNSLDIMNCSDNALVPFSPHVDDSKAKANLPDVPLFQKLLPPASCEQIEKKCLKTTENLRKGNEPHLPANSKESSLLLPEASAFMNDLVVSTVVSGCDHSHTPHFNLVPVEIPCGTAATIAVANTGSSPMPTSDVCTFKSEIQSRMKLITDLAPFSNKSFPVTHTLSPLAAESPVPVVNLQSDEDPSIEHSPTKAKSQDDIAINEASQVTDTTVTLRDELIIKKSEEIILVSANTGSTCPSSSLMEEMTPCLCPSQRTTMEQTHMGDVDEMLDASETLLDEVTGIVSSDNLQAVGQLGCVVIKDAGKKLELEKEAEDGRRGTSAVENIKVFKNLPWKSQIKGASEKLGWSVNKKRRTDNERNVSTADTDVLMESADSVKANVIAEIEAGKKSVCGCASTRLEPVVDEVDRDTDAKKGFFCLSGRMKKLVSVALLLAGVIILGCDAIQRDLASKKDSYCTGKQGDNLCSITSTQMDDHNIVKNSSIYPGQRIQLY